jgi:hypothetical protein
VIRTRKTPARLDVLQILRLPIPLLHQRASPACQDLFEVFPAKSDILASLAYPRRDAPVELVRQRSLARLEFLPADLGDQETYAAVDIETDAARADHATFLRIEGRNPAYGKTITPVDIWHRQGRLYYPG